MGNMSDQSIDDKTATSMKWLVLALIWMTIVSYFILILLRESIKKVPGISTLFLFPKNIKIPYPYNYFGLVISFVGLLLVAWANYNLLVVGKIGLKAREPFHIPSRLIFEGPYKYTRNPIYLAVIIMLLGVVIIFTSLVIAIINVGIFLLFHIKFIGWEEKNLEIVFGNQYLDYKKRVRRWI